jgi:hypothetical protein
VAQAELGEPDRQIAPRRRHPAHQLDVARAAHRLERGLVGALAEREHPVVEPVPVATALPDAAAQQLRSADLAIPRGGDLAAHGVLEEAIDRPAPRVPEHHARRLVLEVAQVEARDQRAVVVGRQQLRVRGVGIR